MRMIHFPEIPMMRASFITSVVLAACLPLAAGISETFGTIRLKAGSLTRTVHLARGSVIATGLAVKGHGLLAAPGPDVDLRISAASPNRRPSGLSATAVPAADWTRVSERSPEGVEDVQWLHPCSPKFGRAVRTITSPSSGVERLVVKMGSDQPAVALTETYEVYAGYPAIRKWLEVKNTGQQWLKIERLVIDAIHLAPAYRNRVLLTPAERGAGSSVIAFANSEHTAGVIAASEIPSAMRTIADDGAMGYSAENFEWVLGPGETFVSEPVFYFAFSGPATKTVSAVSVPLDRTLEDSFQRFLRERIGIAADSGIIPAPQWVSWSNFGIRIDDAIVREQAALAAKAGFASISLDQGWQKGLLGAEPDPAKFPDFKATCEFVRSLGLRLGLWVSSFRTPGSPDLLAMPDSPIVPVRGRQGGVAMSFSSPWRQYYARDLAELSKRYGVTYFKQDFTNIRFGDVAAVHDGRTVKDSVLRGLRGLLEAQDTIRKIAPRVTTEMTHEIYWGTPGVPCDLAAVKAAALYHIPPNDYSGAGPQSRRFSKDWRLDPDQMRRDLVRGCANARNRLYAHRGLPLYAIEYYGAATVNVGGSLSPEVQDRQVCSWLMGAPMVFAGDLVSLSAENIERYRNRFQILRRLQQKYGIYRHFQFSGVPEPTDEGWHWWGKLNEDGEGAAVVMRGNSGEAVRQINLPWVKSDRDYTVRALLTPRDLGRFSGKQLQNGDLKLELPALGQEILEISYTVPGKG